MSSSDPPQLQLTLPPPTQSFKRSFQQFGFDVDSPVSGEGSSTDTTLSGSSSDGNERNKRARSEGISSSSSVEASSSSSGLQATRPDPNESTSMPIDEGRSNTPSSGDEDVVMVDPHSPTTIPSHDQPWPSVSSSAFTESSAEETFRSSLNRFREFDSHLSALRHSPFMNAPPLRAGHIDDTREHDNNSLRSRPFPFGLSSSRGQARGSNTSSELGHALFDSRPPPDSRHSRPPLRSLDLPREIDIYLSSSHPSPDSSSDLRALDLSREFDPPFHRRSSTVDFQAQTRPRPLHSIEEVLPERADRTFRSPETEAAPSLPGIRSYISRAVSPSTSERYTSHQSPYHRERLQHRRSLPPRRHDLHALVNNGSSVGQSSQPHIPSTSAWFSNPSPSPPLERLPLPSFSPFRRQDSGDSSPVDSPPNRDQIHSWPANPVLPPSTVVQHRERSPEVLRPFASDEEERRSLREHVTSLLESLSTPPLLPLSLPSPEQEEPSSPDASISRQRPVMLHRETTAGIRDIHRGTPSDPQFRSVSSLPNRSNRSLPSQSMAAFETAPVTRLMTHSSRPQNRDDDALPLRPMRSGHMSPQPSAEFRQYVSRIPAPPSSAGVPMPELRRPSFPRFDPDGDLNDPSSTSTRSFTARSTERLRHRRQTLMHDAFFSTRNNADRSQFHENPVFNRPRADSELFQSDERGIWRTEHSETSPLDVIGVFTRRDSPDVPTSPFSDDRLRTVVESPARSSAILDSWARSTSTTTRHYSETSETEQPRRRTTFQSHLYSSVPSASASLLSENASERHRANDRRFLAEMMSNDVDRMPSSGFNTRNHGLPPRTEEMHTSDTDNAQNSPDDFVQHARIRNPPSSSAERIDNVHSLFLRRHHADRDTHDDDTLDIDYSNVPTSSEAAALFASAPGSSTTASTYPSLDVLRQRRLMLLPALSTPSAEPIARSPPPISPPSERQARTNPAPPVGRLNVFWSARESGTLGFDLPQVRRRSPVRPSSSTIRERIRYLEQDLAERESNFEAANERELDNPRPAIFARGDDGNGDSRPPFLPPLHFEREPILPFDSDRRTSRPSIDESNVRPMSGSPSGGSSAQQFQEISELRHSAITRQRREVHDIISRRLFPGTVRREERRETTPGSSQYFQQAMDVLRGDGLSTTRQQQFQNAYERERSRERSRPTQWGDIDGEDRQHTLTHFGEAWRRRRNASLYGPRESSGSQGSSHSTIRGSSSRTNESTNAPNPYGQHDQWYARRVSRMRSHARDEPIFGGDSPPRVELPFMSSRSRQRIVRSLGDFIRDEDFDSSYENLLALAASLGDVRPRATPAHVIANLPTAFYKEWQTADSDVRCPICLDDYESLDPVLKLTSCSHWFHKECLEQWLHSASTCPVCRNRVRSSHRSHQSGASSEAGPSGTSHENHASDDEDSDSDGHDPLGISDYS